MTSGYGYHGAGAPDGFVFKVLAHNDTGAARGHQGGIVIPKDIAQFFPPLPQDADRGSPTVDARLTARLYVDGDFRAVVSTRYQHQTWGGTRSPERRLTDNLGPLRNDATAGDIALFAKDLSADNLIDIHLIRKGTPEHERITALAIKRRWGVLDPGNPPVTVDEIHEAEGYVETLSMAPPTAFVGERRTTVTRAVRISRDRAFRRKLLDEYDGRCTLTGRSFRVPEPGTAVGLDAAHIVPVSVSGSDHPSNGLLLTKELHWCFDCGMFGIGEDGRVIVPDSVAVLPGNEFLRDMSGMEMRTTKTASLSVSAEAIAWHRENILLK